MTLLLACFKPWFNLMIREVGQQAILSVSNYWEWLTNEALPWNLSMSSKPYWTYIFGLTFSCQPHTIPINQAIKPLFKPLYKIGTKTQFKNYRPISNTSIFSRLMEKLIVKRIQNYFESNLLWHPSQHGFRKKRSCNTQLLEVITDFHRMADEGLRFDCIYTVNLKWI